MHEQVESLAELATEVDPQVEDLLASPAADGGEAAVVVAGDEQVVPVAIQVRPELDARFRFVLH